MSNYWQTPMTRLEAVNICLSSIGERPVSSLVDCGVDAQMASNILEETNRAIQNYGWEWNREIHTIEPDKDGNLMLPANVSRVRTINWEQDRKLVQRGLRLFDKVNNTYQFTQSVTVDIFVQLPFEELSSSVREAIASRAAMIFQERVMGNDGLDKMLKERYQAAWNTMVRSEMHTSRPNMLRDNASTANMLQRDYFNRGRFR